jgi:hypothetical protein
MSGHSDDSSHEATAKQAQAAQEADFPSTVGEAWAWLLLTAGAPWGIYLVPLLLGALFDVDVAAAWHLPVAAGLSIFTAIYIVMADLLPAYDRRRDTHPS